MLSEAGCRLIQATSVGSRSIPSFGGFREDIRDVGGSTKGKSVTHRLCAKCAALIIKAPSIEQMGSEAVEKTSLKHFC